MMSVTTSVSSAMPSLSVSSRAADHPNTCKNQMNNTGNTSGDSDWQGSVHRSIEKDADKKHEQGGPSRSKEYGYYKSLDDIPYDFSDDSAYHSEDPGSLPAAPVS